MKTVSMPLDEFTKEVNAAHELGKQEGFRRAFDLLVTIVKYNKVPEIGHGMFPAHAAFLSVVCNNQKQLLKDMEKLLEERI